MRTLLLPHNPLILAALVTAVSFQPLLAKSISVVDPSTGETVELSEVNFEALSEEERAEIRDQLKEQESSPAAVIGTPLIFQRLRSSTLQPVKPWRWGISTTRA